MFKKILFCVMFTGLFSLAQADVLSTVNVSGYALLEDLTDHSGIKVRFEAVSPSAVEDSTTTNSDGFYTRNIEVGIYNVYFTKVGYQPGEIPDQFFSETTVLDTVVLEVGNTVEISGYVSGTFTSNNIYFVVGDVTVPSASSLTIEAGTKIKFDGPYNFNVDGILIAQGAEGDTIIFTSKQPVPLPGDWGNINLNGAYSSNISYAKILYATDGIVGSNTSGATFSHLVIKDLQVNARGIYLTGSSGLTITHNVINVSGRGIDCNGASNSNISYNTMTTAGSDGIYCPNATNSNISYNTITTTGSYGIYCPSSSNSTINYNKVSGPPSTGIYAQYSSGATISHNNLTVNYTGIYVPNASGGATVENDTISGFRQYGIYFNSSPNSTIKNNTCFSGYDHDIIGIYGWYSNNSVIERNTIQINDSHNWYSNDHYGIRAYYSIVKLNSILCYSYDYNRGIRADYCQIDSNDVALYHHYGTSYGIEANNSETNPGSITNNTLVFSGPTRGIWATYAIIKNNSISGGTDWGIGYGSNLIITDNVITNQSRGIYLYNSSNTLIKKNVIQINGGTGIHNQNNSVPTIFKNTIISNGSGTGIYATSNSHPEVNSNIIENFSIGINAESEIYEILYNDIYNTTTKFTGSGLPTNIGLTVTENGNDDPCDIYFNIFLDPQFVYPDTNNYELLGNSPCINAGDPDSTDADGTVADIGAKFYYIHQAFSHTPLQRTTDTDGPYPVTAVITDPESDPLTAWLYYRTNPGAFTEVALTNTVGDTFTADIPGQPLNTTVEYYMRATDGADTTSNPLNAPMSLYSFIITLFESFTTLSASSNNDGTINLGWDIPSLLEGTLVGMNLYKDTSSGVPIDADHLLVSLGPTVNTYLDTAVFEGDEYFYKVTGLVEFDADTIESVIASETSVISDNASVVRVEGNVYLENQSDHSGVRIYFEPTSPSAVDDSTFSNSDGSYLEIVKTGIYNIHFTKDGYQPEQLGGQFLSDNRILDDITLIEGSTAHVSGEVSGTFVSTNLYFVDGELTVPEGDTLIIEPGTKLKFNGNYNLTVYGLLLAEGAPGDTILFTSNQPVPMEGDWGKIILSGAPNSKITYAKMLFGTGGVSGNSSSGVEISHCFIDRQALSAKGIYFSGSTSLTLTHNDIQVPGRGIDCEGASNSNISYNTITTATDYGIYCPNATNSNISYNTITNTGSYGIYCPSSSNSTINYNKISGPPSTGIYARYSSGATVSHNNLTVTYNGIYVPNASGVTVENDTITGSIRDYGIYFDSSPNSIVRNNNIFGGDIYDWDRWGIYGWNSNNSLILNNIIQIGTTCDNNAGNYYGIYVSYSSIKNNSIIVYSQYQNRGIRADYCQIDSNDVSLYHYGNTSYGIETYNSGANPGSITNNTLVLSGPTRGIWATYATISNNSISGGSDWGIGYGPGISVEDNIIFNKSTGVYFDNATSSTLKRNLIKINGGTGVNCINNSNPEIFQNTIVSNGSGTGIYTASNAHPTARNNIIMSFYTGVNAESDIYDLFYNDLYDNIQNYMGAGLPAEVGEIVTINNNGDPSDIYSNISLNPLFVGPDTLNYYLQGNSPCIDAGDLLVYDPDVTVSDIGAYYWDHGNPHSPSIPSTGDSTITLQWEPVESDSLVEYKLYQKLSTEDNYTFVSSVSRDSNRYIFTDLINNITYDLGVSSLYSNSESILSKISGKPGVAIIAISPVGLISDFSGNPSVAETLILKNTGTKDSDYRVSAGPNYTIGISDTSGTISPSDSVEVVITLQSSDFYDGIFITSLGVTTDDPDNAEVTIPYLILKNVQPTDPYAQHFNAVDSTGIQYYIVITWAQLDGYSLGTGDEVGIYDDTTCVGAGMYMGSFPMLITAWGENPGQGLPGYTLGHPITYKVFDYSSNREAPTTEATYGVGDGTFNEVGFSSCSLTSSIYRTLEISLEPRRFNLISFNVSPIYGNVSQIFAQQDSLAIVYDDHGGAYVPEYGVNTIGEIDQTEGYHVFLYGGEDSLGVSGLAVNPAQWTLTIKARRFNSIAYLLDAPYNCEDVFSTIAPQIDILQDDEGGAWIPDLSVNTLGNMVPGKGYQIFLSGALDQYFTYSSPVAKRVLESLPIAEVPKHFEFYNTGLPYIIVLRDLVEDSCPFEVGDEIGVFDQGRCVGASVYDGSDKLVIAAWAANDEYNLPGYYPGNPIVIKYYSWVKDSEKEIQIAFESSEASTFGGAAYSSGKIISSQPNLPTEYALEQNYPNPFNPNTTIKYQLPEGTKVTLKIFNLLGQEVITLVDDYQAPGFYKKAWEGKDRYGREISSGIYFYQILTNNFSKTRKMIFLK